MITYDAFKQFGLDETEAKMYLALLELGPSSVAQVTKKAGVTRTLGYVVLEKLGSEGLVTRAKDGAKKIRYFAEHPRSLVQFIRNKKNSWERREEKVESVLPELVSLYKVKDKPAIRYHDGVRGIESMFEETLDATTEILAVTDVESWKDPALLGWARAYNRERYKREVKKRILLLNTPEGREWIKIFRPTPFTTYRWITREQAKGLLEFGGELNIYENKVLIALPKKSQRMTALIESDVLANILKSLFNIVWETSRPAEVRRKRS